jgi:hypothetical protein
VVIEGKLSSDIEKSKVLHDYAFAASMRVLEREGLLFDASQSDWARLSAIGNPFVLIRGTGRFVDYEMLRSYAANESTLLSITSGNAGESQHEVEPAQSRQQRRAVDRQRAKIGQERTQEQVPSSLQQISNFVTGFLGNVVLFRLTNTAGAEFVGPLARTHLREDIKSLIFKYGSQPQGTWEMLALLTRVPEFEQAGCGGERLAEIVAQMNKSGPRSVSQAIESGVLLLNVLQEFFGSVEYPNLIVSPVAIYREIQSTT